MFFIYNTYQKVIANCTIEDSTMARNKEISKKSGTVASINDSLKKPPRKCWFCLYCTKSPCIPMK